jgi:23S rRNA (uracil1939-C5)-methyltransferase
VLYKKVIAAAALTGNETVIDTYCGIGTIGMVLAKAMTSAKTNREGRVIGVELNKEAVKDARANAKRNNIQNIQFVAADATEYMLDMANDGARADVVILDPPRSGCTNEFVQATASISPNRIVYVSCNPETLGRDLGWFKSAGYKAKEAWPVDMFCFTQHCECVVLLERK